jgi:nucleotide-binding universal stress UspA family protein
MTDRIIRVAADGSSGSRRALEWALEEAQLRGCAVELVSVCASADDDARWSAANAAVHATMDDIVAGRADIPLVSWRVVAGDPADVLARESEHSALLVVGSHGQTSVRHSALTSVSELLSMTAACPVVIVPPPHRADEAAGVVQIGATP